MGIVLTSITRALAVATLFIAAVLGHATSAQAQTAIADPTSSQAAKCSALMEQDFATIPDAPTHINSAKLVAATAEKPAYCEVDGYVAPQVGILMWLPVQGWNGKFMEVGCGGFCGTLAYIGTCEGPLRKGYACITTDMGHRNAQEVSGLEWAYNNTPAVIDFAYRATHVTALAGKAIVRDFYGKAPDKSYFSGCSCGGRQALVEAQRFPWDFNGIIVGAPGINYSEFTLNFALRANVLHAGGGKSLFEPRDIQFLGKAIIDKCDMDDGLKDGQIGDPRLCKFNPRDYVCQAAATTNCLTRQQAEAALSFYRERTSASGDRPGGGAFVPGWETSYLGMGDSPVLHRSFYEDFFRYMALVPNPGPSWKFENFDLNADYKRLGMIQSLLGADNPDLSKFKAAGGKLIFYHGWGDGGLTPLTSIDYYRTVERTMGGRAATQGFLRLFMVPDMDHCFGGMGPWTIDYLGYLESWVEQGKAPDVMTGAHYGDDPMTQANGKPQFTRPIYPYPLRAQYKGAGDPNSAASFKPVNSES